MLAFSGRLRLWVMLPLLAISGFAMGCLSISPASHDYGSVVIGTSSPPSTYTVTNTDPTASTGVPSVALGGADVSQFTMSNNTCVGPLAPNATCSVNVGFAPTTTGAKTASLNIAASPGGSAISSLSGTAVAIIGVAPTSHDYGSVATGSTNSFFFLVVNQGAITATGLAFSLGGPDAGQFTITTNSCTSSLAAGTFCGLTVSFAPSTAGTKAASLNISSTNVGIATAGLAGSAH